LRTSLSKSSTYVLKNQKNHTPRKIRTIRVRVGHSSSARENLNLPKFKRACSHSKGDIQPVLSLSRVSFLARTLTGVRAKELVFQFPLHSVEI